MRIISAVDQNWAIGNQNQLLVKIPEDMEFFKEKTMGKIVVMGRKTLESLPFKRGLKGRKNYVLTRQANYTAENITVAGSLKEVFCLLSCALPDQIYIIGGEQIYNLFLPYCNTAYITKIDKAFSADAFFPNLERISGWQKIKETEPHLFEGICYRFTKYERKGEGKAEI